MQAMSAAALALPIRGMKGKVQEETSTKCELTVFSKHKPHCSIFLHSARVFLCWMMTSDIDATVLSSCACLARESSTFSRFTCIGFTGGKAQFAAPTHLHQSCKITFIPA
jgi:hypothetical protein